jgi:hypothetical protein
VDRGVDTVRISRGAKGALMGFWLMLTLLNLMFFVVNLEWWSAGRHDDSFLLLLNLMSAILCARGYTQAKNMKVKEIEDDDS